MRKIAVLITCHNRKQKTIQCLNLLYQSDYSQLFTFDVYLVDDGSSDGTKEAVAEQFPEVKITVADGSLFWAAGSKLAWENALNSGISYDYYLLLNDDTQLLPNTFQVFANDIAQINSDTFILVGSTLGPDGTTQTYGGRKLKQPGNPKSSIVLPTKTGPQLCDLGNANIMLISHPVVAKIGTLTTVYQHGFADYEYTLTARENNIPVYVCSEYIGLCENDHGQKWLSAGSALKDRLKFMYSVKGLSYNNYMYFYKRHFPKYVLQEKAKMWLKTLFPIVYDKFKK